MIEWCIPMSYKIITTSIESLVIIEPKVHTDSRGLFIKKYLNSFYEKSGLFGVVAEELISKSKLGTIRGLHFQNKNPQAKLINVIKGRIYDVAVDLRLGSPTYGMHFGLELSSENNLMLFIPEGFAHGFLSLEEDTIVSYLCSTEYEPDHDSGIRFDDPDLNIQWPILDLDYVLSEKDLNLSRFRDFQGFSDINIQYL